MRNPSFVAVHRGGRLTPEGHRQLMAWALLCLQAADALYGRPLDPPLLLAREAAESWRLGLCPPGVPIKAAREVHRFARTLENPVECAVARAFGHAAATAHMADHALGVPLYLARARRAAGEDVAAPRRRELSDLETLCPSLAGEAAATLLEKEKPFIGQKKTQG